MFYTWNVFFVTSQKLRWVRNNKFSLEDALRGRKPVHSLTLIDGFLFVILHTERDALILSEL